MKNLKALKVDPWVELLGQPLSRNHVFKIFTGETPIPHSPKVTSIFVVKGFILLFEIFKRVLFDYLLSSYSILYWYHISEAYD